MSGQDIVAHCDYTEAGTFTTVRVGAKCTVTYQFDTSATNADLALRYLVSFDGKVLPIDGGKPQVLSAARRQIVVSVDAGTTVALYLNSDVHPDFRRHPVYAVTAGANDVEVFITEKKGRGNTRLKGQLDAPCQRCATAKGWLEIHRTFLTGDIWALVSNRYTAEEADAMLPDGTAPAVRAAVRAIYSGLPSPELIVRLPASDSAPKRTLRVRFDEAENVRENTAYLNQLTEVLPRTHPRAYAALLEEAAATGITELRVTSGWRPMLGSIVHRAGLGLDVNYLEREGEHVHINRAALTNARMRPDDNVSERERALYVEYEQAKAETEMRTRELKVAQDALARGRKAADTAQLQNNVHLAEGQATDARKAEADASRAWDKERGTHESDLMRDLRGNLHRHKSVSQVLDPWYLDMNTQNSSHPVPNEQRSGNEKTHNNHLHITVIDAKIL